MNGESEQVVEQVVDQDLSPDSETGTGKETEIETRARRMGWTDQDEFKGHPDRWVDAETYVRKADEHLPILKGTLNTMEKKMVEQEKLIRDMKADIQEFVGYTRKAEERAYEKALAQMKVEQRQAVEDQDLDKFDVISKEIDEHLKGGHPAAMSGSSKTDAEKKAEQEQYATPEVYNSWLVDNQWYIEKPKMADFALRMDRWLSDTRPGQNQKERLAEITKLVKDEFPEYWPNPKRVTAQTVEGGDGTGVVNRTGKKMYANLPAEAKAACDRFTGKDGKGTSGTIPGYTRDNYLQDYDWPE